MNKVICDVCGTDYPETAAQCPICGCARAGGAQTSAGNTPAAEEEQAAYTYVKGGRFSKANVRKRLKAAQVAPESRIVEPVDEPDDDVEDEEEGGGSNRGLILIVVLLLLAIIAVSSYIAITYFDFGGNDETKPTGTTQSTDPTGTTGQRIDCTKVVLSNVEETLVAADSVVTLEWTVEPLDTTDAVQFASSDPSVAVVDANGRVSAVGNGTAVITVTCGSAQAQCTVICDFEDVTQPTDPTDPTDPIEPTDPDEDVVLELNRSDFTLSFKGDSWKVYSGELDPAEITWTSDNEQVVTVTDGKVVAVGVGNTTIHAEYKGQKASCKVYCRWTEENTEPTEPTDPTQPADPTEPGEDVVLELNRSDFTLSFKGDSWNVYSGDLDPAEITWTSGDESVVTVTNGKVVAVGIGNTTIYAEYQGQKVSCKVYCKWTEETA